MKKKTIFFFSTLLLLAVLILSVISSNIQNDKSELLLNEIKRTQNYNANLATINKFYAEATIFYNVENLSNYADCNVVEFQNHTTCKALKSVNTIQKSQKLSDELRYFYFDDSFIQEVKTKSILVLWLDVIQYILLAIALLGQTYIFLFAKDKDY